MSQGFYNAIADLVDPKDDEVVVDVGTGLGHLLVALTVKNPKSVIIGTERTMRNLSAAFNYLDSLGIADSLAVLENAELRWTPDQRVFWHRSLDAFADDRAKIHEILREKIMLIGDDILHSTFLPDILPEPRIDAGILSMPGGAPNRAWLWPMKMERAKDAEIQRRIANISDTTRLAFFHFMSEHVPPGGRIVVAERFGTEHGKDTPQNFATSVRGKMRDLRKYWDTKTVLQVDADLANGATELMIEDVDRQKFIPVKEVDRSIQQTIGIIRFDRNDVTFNELPPERPMPA
jgi:hypothetical protein